MPRRRRRIWWRRRRLHMGNPLLVRLAKAPLRELWKEGQAEVGFRRALPRMQREADPYMFQARPFGDADGEFNALKRNAQILDNRHVLRITLRVKCRKRKRIPNTRCSI